MQYSALLRINANLFRRMEKCKKFLRHICGIHWEMTAVQRASKFARNLINNESSEVTCVK